MKKNLPDSKAAAETAGKLKGGDDSLAQERPAERAGDDRARFSPLRYELAKIPAGNEPTRTSAISAVLLEEALRVNASDIHFDPVEAEYQVRFRVDGALGEPVTLHFQEGLHLVRSFKSRAGLDPGFTLKPLSGRAEVALTGRVLPVRVATAPAIQGEKLALRLLPSQFARLSLSRLGLSERDHDQVRNCVQDVRGMVLVSGPTGAGKTTTLYALMRELAQTRYSIVSIEDPVEYVLPGVTQIQVNERQGLTFAEGIRGILRLDPDIIMMGEMRERASAGAAVEAAESGHVFLSTLHARDAAGTITVLRNFGMTDHEIAATLDLIIAQRLVRRLCSSCRRLEPPTPAEEQMLAASGFSIAKETWHAWGCDECGGSGYRGRVGVFEMHRLDEEDADAILAHVDEHTFRRSLRRHGATSLLEDAMLKTTAGLTSLAELEALGGFSFYTRQEKSQEASVGGPCS